MADLEWLRHAAQAEADRWNEPALVILDPPPKLTSGHCDVIPYVVLLSVASQAEKAAAVERVEPAAVKRAFPFPHLGTVWPAPKSDVWYEETVEVVTEFLG